MREHHAQRGAISRDAGPEPRELGGKDGASFQIIVLVSDTSRR